MENENNVEQVKPVIIPESKKTKKSNVLVIILIIIILVLLGTCGYFVYDKYFSNKPSITTCDNTGVDVDDTNDDKELLSDIEANVVEDGYKLNESDMKAFAKALVDKYIGVFSGSFPLNVLDLSDEHKAYIAIHNISKSDFHELRQDKLESDYNIKIAIEGPSSETKYVTAVLTQTIKGKYQELFGENMPDNIENIKLTCGNYELYNNISFNQDYYLFRPRNLSCINWDTYPEYSITALNKLDSKLEVNIQFVRSFDPNDAHTDNPFAADVGLQKNYKLTFENKNENYILISSKEV